MKPASFTPALIAALALAGAQFAAAQDKPSPEAPKPAPEAKAPAKAPTPRKHTSKRSEDARRCLQLDGNTAIIKCAEEYL